MFLGDDLGALCVFAVPKLLQFVNPLQEATSRFSSVSGRISNLVSHHLAAQGLVPEMPPARQDHGDAELIARLDDVVVADRASGLDDSAHTGFVQRLDPVRKREEGIGRSNTCLLYTSDAADDSSVV